ncbi:glutamyl-tRNA reductase [Ornithinicoccus hortensis]|uniref:Glutamyl-tRNA reductase n=1 Tax=Ornithinicoccus hortensis TaxID=82346 RepID=A0A542YVU4_9MICO|nr:glutamyl-tRNA reductase [Ornithinicoccus hortensis]TQL52197.1 glutamyl-tRNA reductase [Ornithinicoccus hortensis]
MSLLVVGLSHRSAPMDLVEQASPGDAGAAALTAAVRAGEDVGEAVVLATCNRTEVYVDAATFHGALQEVGQALSHLSGVALDELSPHLYVHYEDRAVHHLFSVASGLDSMAVGERQILGQVRAAFRAAQHEGAAGTVLNPLFQHALRVGKQAHTETSIDRVSRSLVELGLERAAGHLESLAGARTVLIGAGSMSGLAAATLSRSGISDVTVINRTRERADRLAAQYGFRSEDWSRLPELGARADLIVTCTGATQHVVDEAAVRRVRGSADTPLAILDLAMPRDVAPGVGALPGVGLWSLADLQERAEDSGAEVDPAVAEVRQLVTGEVGAYLVSRRAQAVAPTVTALRSRAADVVAAELQRLDQRLPDLPERERQEVQRTVQRVVDKLLHAPTVRVKALASDTDGRGDYASVLRELFDLDPYDVAAVSTPPETGGLV